MVFKSLSWQEFLITASVLSSLWHLAVLPLLYRKQLKDWLGKKDDKPDLRPVSREWDEELVDEPEDGENELMGKSKMQEGVSRVSMNMFGFAPDVEVEESHERQQSLVPDVIEELKSIFHIIEKEQGTKEDFFSLFGLLKAKYASLRDTPSQRALNEYIRENALFPISDEELTQLWN
ncbi:hypothetical protein FHW88_000439 [Mucilaginibacter sp. SG538B]|uniref:hypothetical protein n=1 Tax=Mucilaginibacter sp. SG538B TaxID=2587021 RepID=UPI00159E8008|nr:hypothetical protein [Mucilaginibacter sp. SG538B]NVM62163.1 hypothetical protein [Mucilaginibacter sp. SG538B]